MESAANIFAHGVAGLQVNDYARAEEIFADLLNVLPGHIPSLLNLAIAQQARGKLQSAENTLKEIIRNQHNNIDAKLMLARLFLVENRYQEVLRVYEEIIRTNPSIFEVHCNKAAILNEIGQHENAVASASAALEIDPRNANAHLNHGNALFNLRKYSEACVAYRCALDIDANNIGSLTGLGNALVELRLNDKALAIYDQLLGNNPNHVGALVGRANLLFEARRHEEALISYDNALSIQPDLAKAWYGRGRVLFELNRYDAAAAAYNKALELKPEFPEAWLGLGNLFSKLKRYGESFAAYDKALVLKPDLPDAWLGRGNLFSELKRYDDSFAAYEKALALRPDLADAWLGRGNLFGELKQYDESFAAYEKALALNADLAEAWLGRGNLFGELKRYAEAFVAYTKALSLKPGLSFSEGLRLHAKMHLCDWSNFAAECEQLVSSVVAGQLVTPPFQFLAVPSSPDEQFECAKLFINKTHPAFENPVWRAERYDHERIRVAYLSADFHEHATSYLMAEMFERHDRSRFEIMAISFGPDIENAMRQRLKRGFDKFINVANRSDLEIAEIVKNLEIDIAVDLKGFTQGARLGIFSMRAAPIQVSYLGYPGTLGAEYIDYLIADRVLIPRTAQAHYKENIVYLPDTYQVNDSKRIIAPSNFTREQVGLPPSGFVFCCFNNNYKINPDVFDCWMRILKNVDGSILWLMKDNEISASNLRKEAEVRGVSPKRLVFADRLPLSEHLARHRLADLFLDTLPYNAHTTASDALWAGLPVLTQIGETFPGKVAASLLTAIGLTELIATNSKAYVALAIELATSRERFEAVKQKLETNRLTKPLFDTERFTRRIEAAYAAMHERHQAGLPPDHIYVT